jgi:hypothetical protein
LEIEFTQDIPELVAQELVEDLRRSGQEVHTERLLMRSLEPPSWIALTSDLSGWLTVLGGVAATASAAKLGSLAATDIWKNKGKIASALGALAFAPLRHLARSLIEAKNASSRTPEIDIRLRVSEIVVLRLRCESEDSESIARDLFRFFIFAPHLQSEAERQIVDALEPLTDVQITFKSDGTTELRWIGGRELQERVVRVKTEP